MPDKLLFGEGRAAPRTRAAVRPRSRAEKAGTKRCRGRDEGEEKHLPADGWIRLKCTEGGLEVPALEMLLRKSGSEGESAKLYR